MRLYAAAGQRYLAVEQFRGCQEALRRELEAEPEPETAALYERILSGEPRRETPADDALPASALPGVAAAPPPAAPKSRLARLWFVAGLAALTCLGGLAVYLGRTPPVRFVAIMPLTPAADSPELEYIAEGITESVINDLSRLRHVRVMARSTVYRYRAKGSIRWQRRRR